MVKTPVKQYKLPINTRGSCFYFKSKSVYSTTTHQLIPVKGLKVITIESFFSFIPTCLCMFFSSAIYKNSHFDFHLMTNKINNRLLSS